MVHTLPLTRKGWVQGWSYGEVAVRAGGLHQAGCWWWHAILQGTWRGQAVRGGGLYQVRSRRRGALYGA
jgi:hypothetical protein